MKLLVISQYFYPEQFGVNDICSKLSRMGHEITVLTGLPNYPMGEIYDGYHWTDLQINPETGCFHEQYHGVNVLRCKLFPRKSGKLHLAYNYLSFVFYSVLSIKKIIKSSKTKEKPAFDAILVTQYSPITMAIPAIIARRSLKVPFVLYCFDLWPESIASANLPTDGPFYHAVRIISRYIYRQADRAIVSSRKFETYLRSKHGLSAPLHYLPMYAEDQFSEMEPLADSSPSHSFNFVFAGNIGNMQHVETIIMAAAEISKMHLDLLQKPILIHLVGDGSAVDNCKSLASDLGVIVSDQEKRAWDKGQVATWRCGVFFHGRHPVEEMPRFYQMADAMLITLRKDPLISYTLPNKVQTYMAAGKPIIAAIDGEAADVIREAKCGYVGEAEDYLDLSRHILYFLRVLPQDGTIAEEVASLTPYQMGFNARSYYDEYFNSEDFLKSLINILES